MKGMRLLVVAVMLAGLVSFVIGIVFIQKSVYVNTIVTEGLAAEGQTSQLPKEGKKGYIEGNVVDTAKEAMAVASYLTGHMHGEDGNDRYNTLPRDSEERARYLDGLGLVTALNVAVASFGVAQIALASGIIMIATGLALGAIGLVLWKGVLNKVTIA